MTFDDITRDGWTAIVSQDKGRKAVGDKFVTLVRDGEPQQFTGKDKTVDKALDQAVLNVAFGKGEPRGRI